MSMNAQENRIKKVVSSFEKELKKVSDLDSINKLCSGSLDEIEYLKNDVANIMTSGIYSAGFSETQKKNFADSYANIAKTNIEYIKYITEEKISKL